MTATPITLAILLALALATVLQQRRTLRKVRAQRDRMAARPWRPRRPISASDLAELTAPRTDGGDA